MSWEVRFAFYLIIILIGASGHVLISDKYKRFKLFAVVTMFVGLGLLEWLIRTL